MRGIELRDPVHGPIPVNRGELAIIDSAEVQRLRRIKQLGFADRVFPGAVHNRYLHSIGAMHLAGRAFDALTTSMPLQDPTAEARLRQTVRLAALLHDIGHPPLSHAAESLLPSLVELQVPGKEDATGNASHEDMTAKLILDSPLAACILESFGEQGIAPEHVVALIDEDRAVPSDVFGLNGQDYRYLLHSLVSGELDVDRMDYLLRDSYFSGVSYGRYDLDWLLSNLVCLADSDTPSVLRAGIRMQALAAFEHFLLARYHMFQMVYFHPKSDVYDAMLRRWLQEVGEVARFPAEPSQYVQCDDAWLMASLRASSNCWAQRVVERRPLSLVTELRGASPQLDLSAALRALESRGIEALALTAKPVLSRYAQSPAHLRLNPLLVLDARHAVEAKRVQRIEDVTDLFERYETTVNRQRIYAPSECRDEAIALVGTMMSSA